MDKALDGSVNRHGGVPRGQYAIGESNTDERARERAEAVEARMFDTLWANRWNCPECAHKIMPMGLSRHLRECELLRSRAEAECDAAERGR